MVESRRFPYKLGRAVIYISVVLLMLVCILPLWNIVAVSFSAREAVDANLVGLWPVRFSTVAYDKLLGDNQFWRSFLISIERVFLGLLFNTVLVTLMAYPLSKSKRQFPMGSWYMRLLIFAMLFSGGLIPTYLTVRNLQLLNTIWALVLPGAVPIFNVILLINFFRGIPKSLEEAAIIDGATPFQILIRIFVPCSIAVMATLALFSIVGHWNDFYSGLIYIRTRERLPLMTYIQSFNVDIIGLVNSGNMTSLARAMEMSSRNLNAAKIMIAIIPLLSIYPMLQKYFITGIVMGSVKE
jgi:putative aldouronate transport system permease protein